ncbi:hypothetical protein [Lentibacillus cibarius]|uniref:hypothetical protein n=1 Tax=Lentibacillus cibarius TaxID=2583219 RepID=UPI00159FF082|nr:hypothetical protein [Lentibacillus cibarius]
MSMPNIPDITPEISLNRCEAINLTLTSIALEEISLSHILNAEGEKVQGMINKACSFDDYLKTNESMHATLRSIIKSQMLLQFKLEDVITINKDSSQHRCEKCIKQCRYHGTSYCKCSSLENCPYCCSFRQYKKQDKSSK